MKKLITFLLIISFNSSIYSQPAKPNKVGQFGDFVGVVNFGGMLEGQSMFTIYSEVLRAEVTFFSGSGIANPPKVNYGRYFELINDIYSYGADRRPYVVAVKAKSVLQENWGRGGFDLVWTPIKITLISTSSSLEGPNDEHKLEAKTEDIILESLSPNVKLDIIGKSIKIGNLEVAQNEVIIYDSVDYKLDFTDPLSVVNGLIFASKTKNIELASLVFDPFAQSGEMYRNKTLYLNKDSEHIDELYQMRFSFINGKFVNTGFGDSGYVLMWLKTPIKEYQEKVYLIRRFGNWYISGF